MEDISIEEAEKYGIKNQHSILDTGEMRFRQICLKDNSAYIRAEGGKKGYWQKSHYHKYAREIYIIQKGSVIVAEYVKNKVKIKKHKEGDVFIIEPNIPHNIYMYPNTVSHTVKFGESDEYDWIRCEELDEKVKNIKINYND